MGMWVDSMGSILLVGDVLLSLGVYVVKKRWFNVHVIVNNLSRSFCLP